MFVFFGAIAGYVSARIYKCKLNETSLNKCVNDSFYLVMGGLRWKTNVLMSAFLVSGVIFAAFFIVNLFLWGAQSSAAIPFTTLIALLCLWFGISLPLTFIGSFLGFRRVVCL